MRKFLALTCSVGILAGFIAGCSGGGEEKAASSQSPTNTTTAPVTTPTPTPTAVPIQNLYSTSTTQITSKTVIAAAGGTVATPDNSVNLNFPAGALKGNTGIVISAVHNPQPSPPLGWNFVGTVTDLGPTGTTFALPATLKIAFTQNQLNWAGISSAVDMKLLTSENKTGPWSEVPITNIDLNNSIVTAQISHFSFYALVGLSGTPPTDFGKLQMGDMIFTFSSYLDSLLFGWIPGHVGLNTGENSWSINDTGKQKVSADVIRCGMYNTVESLLGGVQLSYYNYPGTVQSCKVATTFWGNTPPLGYREPKDVVLTQEQRVKMVEYAVAQVGKPYAYSVLVGDAYGLLPGENVEGPDKFNCVGLIQKASMVAGVNGGDGIFSPLENKLVITPAELYSKTKPAGGTNVGPTVNWATISPSKGTPVTNVLIQVSVSHPYGLGFIEKVSYVTDDGYVNPAININDNATDGDLKADDGIFSVSALAGGDALQKTMGLTLTVTDKDGKTDSKHIVYTYTTSSGSTYGEVAARQLQSQSLGR